MTTLDNVLSFIQLSSLINSINVQEIGSKSNWTTLLVSYLKKWRFTKRKGGRKKAEGPSSTIHLNEGHLI